MSLFPEAKFTVRLPSTGVIPGTLLEGKLIVSVPTEIPRAERIEMFFRTDARIHYAGQSSLNYDRTLFMAPLRVELDRTRPLPAGTYAYPFSIEIPPWLPPAYVGTHCGIEHSFEVRLDVDWARDPTAVLTPTVLLPPVDADSHSVTTRSRPDFYEDLVIDVTIDQNTLVHGEPVSGAIALRGGHEVPFEAVRVSYASLATMVMAQGEKRRGTAVKWRIPAATLRTGQAIPFRLAFPPNVPPSFRTGFIDHDVVVAIDVETTWSVVSGFYVPLRIVPAGSTVHATSTGGIALGSERLAGLARAVAEETGFAVGRLPIMALGQVGPLSVYIADGPREGRIGIDIEMEFPDLELGIHYRPLGVLEGFRQSPFLPPGLATSHFLRVEPARAEGGEIPLPVTEEALKELFGTIFHGLDSRNEVRLSDHHFGLHLVLRGDGREDLVEAARWTKRRAEAIVREIGRLPFAAIHPDAEAAWQATAREEKAFLLPHVPAIHGITVSARVMGGESRSVGITLRTRKDRTIAADLDLRTAPLPMGADIAAATAVTAVFPRFRVHSPERVTLEGAAFVADPRRLLGTLETFLGWLIEARGEKRTDSPYR